MFVRWKKRESRGNRGYNAWREVRDITLSAFIVQSERVNGKPRQKVVAYLHKIHKYDLEREDWIGRNERAAFWHHVNRKLRTLQLTDTEQEKVRNVLSKVVPLLTEQEQAEWTTANQRLRIVTGKGLL